MGSVTGGKGGGSGAAPMLEYGNKALQLQKDQFDYTKQVSQPYVGAGSSAINKLSNLLGLGSTAPKVDSSGLKGNISGYLYSKSPTEIGKSIYYNPTGNSSNTTGGTGYFDTGIKITEGPASNEQQLLDEATARINAQLPQYTPDADTGSLLKNYTGQEIYNDPSYKFRLDQGNKAMERQLAASGKYLTPAASLALQEYGQNMGSQEYQNAYNRFNNDQNNLYNRLAGISGIGQNQTNQVIGAGQNYANQSGQLYTDMGNAIVAANQAKAARKGSMFNTLLGAGAKLGSSYLTGGLV